MKEKITIRRFVESDAEAVQNMIHRGLREINGKDYPPELMEEYCHYFTLEKIKSQADSAHTYVAVAADKVIGTGSIAPYWGSLTESILLTIYTLPECIGKGVGTAIVKALEQDEYFLRADRIEIRITRAENVVSVRVRDNGSGCHDLEEGFGLRHMRERLEMLGGTLAYGNLDKDAQDGYTGFFITACLYVRDRKGE